ncbi:hypothetical protein GBAR_LOCUS9460, partial [Geodia barretti]
MLDAVPGEREKWSSPGLLLLSPSVMESSPATLSPAPPPPPPSLTPPPPSLDLTQWPASLPTLTTPVLWWPVTLGALDLLPTPHSTLNKTSSERSLKLEHITAAVVKELKSSCSECGPEMIDNQLFVCYPESPSFLTYRARLEGTSERDSGSLVSLIEAWVRGGEASLIMTGVLMTVDSHCSVAISSLNEPECSTDMPA